MTVGSTPRFGLPQWGDPDNDGPTHGEFNAAFLSLDNAALDAQGTQGNRPSGGLSGLYYTVGADADADRVGITYRSTGSTWVSLAGKAENSISWSTNPGLPAGIFRAAANQNAAVLDVQTAGKVSIFHVDPQGITYTAGVKVGAASSSNASIATVAPSGGATALAVLARSDQTADVVTAVLSDGTTGARLTSDLRLAVGNPGVGAEGGSMVTFSNRSSSDTILSVKSGTSTLTGDMLHFETSGGTVLGTFRNSGVLSSSAARFGPGAVSSPDGVPLNANAPEGQGWTPTAEVLVASASEAAPYERGIVIRGLSTGAAVVRRVGAMFKLADETQPSNSAASVFVAAASQNSQGANPTFEVWTSGTRAMALQSGAQGCLFVGDGDPTAAGAAARLWVAGNATVTGMVSAQGMAAVSRVRGLGSTTAAGYSNLSSETSAGQLVFIAPPSGKVLVSFGGLCQAPAGTTASTAYRVFDVGSNTTVQAFNDDHAAVQQASAGSAAYGTVGCTDLVQNLTPGRTYSIILGSKSTGNSAAMGYWTTVVTPQIG